MLSKILPMLSLTTMMAMTTLRHEANRKQNPVGRRVRVPAAGPNIKTAGTTRFRAFRRESWRGSPDRSRGALGPFARAGAAAIG